MKESIALFVDRMVDVFRLPKITKKNTYNRHIIARGSYFGREYELHATKGWRSRRA